MRQIEFRAWDKKAKVMVYPVVVYETQDHVGFSAQTFKRCYDQNEWYEHLEVGDDWYYLFDNRGVMQYTGLQDANGQKIFEGDVLKAFNSTKEISITGIVYFHSGTYKLKRITQTSGAIKYGYIDFVVYWSDGTHNWETVEQHQRYELEIIGNIYQNKELLKEVAK